MEEIEEIDKIVSILNKLNIYKDLRLEILRYYHSLKNKKKYEFLYLDGCPNGYHEIFPEMPVEQIDLTNFYRYLSTESYRLNTDFDVDKIHKNYIELIYYHDNGYEELRNYKTTNLLNELKTNKKIDRHILPIDFLFGQSYKDISLSIKYIEL